MLSAAALRSRTKVLALRGVRAYLEGETVYGFRIPRKLQLPPYSAEEIANRKENANLLRMVSSFRTYGHLEADLDPLGLQNRGKAQELRLEEYGLEKDDGKRFKTAGILHMKGASSEASLNDIVGHLRATYCGRIAFEFEHLVNPSERRWFAEMVEGHQSPELSDKDKLHIHGLLARSEVHTADAASRWSHTRPCRPLTSSWRSASRR